MGYLSVERYRCSARSQSPRRQKGTVDGFEKVSDIDIVDGDGGKREGGVDVDVMDGKRSAEGLAETAAVGVTGSEKPSIYSCACCA